MTITNYNKGQYIKVESEYIRGLADDDNPYTKVEITINRNCCGNGDTQNFNYASLSSEEDTWQADLNTAQKLNQSLQGLFLLNVVTGILNNGLTVPVDLSYVEDNCTLDSCTLQDFDTHFIPLIKNQIDVFFDTLGIASDVAVTLDENVLRIGDLPQNYILSKYSYGTSSPFTEVPAGYNGIYPNAFIMGGDLFITPAFFNNSTAPKMVDGVYNINLKYTAPDLSSIQESQCAFIDIDTRCKVAGTLAQLLEEAKKPTDESVASMIHALHYALTIGGNCGCNCNELCQAYTELYRLLTKYSDIVNTDCGC